MEYSFTIGYKETLTNPTSMNFPGGTELLNYEKPHSSLQLATGKAYNRPVIVLATALITQETIFSN